MYLIMECCSGGELFEQFTKHAPSGCPERLAAALIMDMFSAVRYLHSHGIAHRDLKVRLGLDKPSLALLTSRPTNRHGIAHRDLKLENFLFEGDNGMYSALKVRSYVMGGPAWVTHI